MLIVLCLTILFSSLPDQLTHAQTDIETQPTTPLEQLEIEQQQLQIKEPNSYHLVTNQDSLVQKLAEQNLLTIEDHYPLVGSYKVTIAPQHYEAVSSQFPATSLEQDIALGIAADTITENLTQITARPGDRLPYTGKGVKVAVLDTGVDTEHRDLDVVGGICTYDNECGAGVSYDDNEGHGTHVAGIIAAKANSTGIIGVAPGVELYSIKALSYMGSGTTTSIVKGIEWAIANDMDIVNMSVWSNDNSTAIRNALQAAYDHGILLVGAAGNEGLADTSTVKYPAKLSTVIAVAAVDSKNVRTSTSSVGPEVEFTAPGKDIFSSYPIEKDYNDDKFDSYFAQSGTSMAAPHITALLALYKERFPNLTNRELRTLLQETVTDLGAPGRDNYHGYGLAMYKKALPNGVSFTVEIDRNRAIITGSDKARFTSVTVGSTTYKPVDGKVTLYGVKGTIEVFFNWTRDGKIINEKRDITFSEPSYTDVRTTSWFAPHVGFLHYHNQLSGYDDNTFRPSNVITRAEAIALISRAKGLDGTKRETRFTDVNPDSFASGYIESAAAEGIVSGYPDGHFHPNQKVTRAEMAILIQKAFNLPVPVTASTFTDVTQSMASYDAIRAIVGARVTLGYGDQTFKPYNSMTRAEFAAFLARVQQ